MNTHPIMPSAQDDEEYYPGGGFIYEEPLRIGPLVITTSHDYMLNLETIHAAYRELGATDDEIEIFDEDCGALGDSDGVVGTIQALALLHVQNEVLDVQTIARNFNASGIGTDDWNIEQGVQASGLDALAAAFSLDDLVPQRERDKIIVPEYRPGCPNLLEIKSGLLPPRPPLLWQASGQIVAILLQKYRSRTPYRLRSNGTWQQAIGEFLPEGCALGPEEHFDEAYEGRVSDALLDSDGSSSLASLYTDSHVAARSNSRPKGGIVLAVMSSGSMHNIGTHSYVLQADVTIPLDFSQADDALCELFAAIAGEGLACATGSHSLHQIISALLSSAMDLGGSCEEVIVESQGDDIQFKPKEPFPLHISDSSHPFQQSLEGHPHKMRDRVRPEGVYGIDVTSTAGVWEKVKFRRKVIAISKYDLGCLLTRTLPRNPAQAVAAGIACCLAVEHSTFYGLPNLDSLPKDLRLQYKISNIVNRMSQRTLTVLSHMSYEAVIAESLVDASSLDIFAQGKSYREKADVLIKAIEALPAQDNYAFPPLPVSEIVDMPAEPQHIVVVDEEIHVPGRALLSMDPCPSLRPPDQSYFLKAFPANGRFPYQDVKKVCRMLQEGLLVSKGLVHKGPIQQANEDDPDHQFWNTASEIYASSAVAQFAEIRADLVRQVDQNPPGNPNIWKSKLVYKNKVVLFYRIRDPVNDARGYRIDWFALSGFNVIGGVKVSAAGKEPLYLWPRQRMRSQEMELAGMAPRRLKLVLFTMLTMMRPTGSNLKEICKAWQKLALTTVTASWASGANFITCRHLSAALSSPSPPFDAMAKKFKPPKTAACVLYFESLLSALKSWSERDQYRSRCPILDLPRAFSQLEAYWQVWVPDELADTVKHYTDCVLGLAAEYKDLEDSARIRIADLLAQYELITRAEITIPEIRSSVRRSCSLDTGGKFGWSVFGSLASGYALTLEGSPSRFDKSFSRGGKARNITDHLTVRHSGRINSIGEMEKGTVAEMIIKQGLDSYLSTLWPSVRFYYSRRPYFMNHPKNGEHKDREISITDPDSRIMLNDAEHICGEYGRTTQIDMLKRPDKDSFFYRISTEALLSGGVIQSSDASRFAAMMSNVAVGLTCSVLSAIGGSTHLASAAATYTRLASRQMVIDTSIMGEIKKRLEVCQNPEEISTLQYTQKWVGQMPKIGSLGADDLKWYCTASHTGQGMSHVGMSIEHGGALIMSIEAAKRVEIYVAGQRALVNGVPLVTSDDSTIVAGMQDTEEGDKFSRSERQRACHMFLHVQRTCRQIALRAVSVLPNLSKEKASGTAGEFNSQDNGIGVSCPILGFREMICQLTRPSAPSLINDYLDSHAYARTVSMFGMGLSAGYYAHRIKLDAVEQRWGLTGEERAYLMAIRMLPDCLITGASGNRLLSSPTSLLHPLVRDSLMQMAHNYHAEAGITNIHTRDLAFTVLGHISVSMRSQHKRAIHTIQTQISKLKSMGHEHQACMLEQSLQATLSSARTRNAGRVAQRVRGRVVCPPPCLGKTFQKAPFIEATLTWFDYVSTEMYQQAPSEEIRALGTMYGAEVVAHKPSRLRFPEPSTRTRTKRQSSRKPIFLLDTYGKTPFGKHVVARAGATLIKAYGPEERKAMHLHDAIRSYRFIPEHTVYGGRLPISWSRFTSCVLRSRSARIEASLWLSSETNWGYMDDDSVQFLREVESRNMGVPVLAMNYASGGRAHFHCVHNGTPYSASIDFDPKTAARYQEIYCKARGGKEVVLAMQNWGSDRMWYGIGPSAQEIEAFQSELPQEFPNSDVEVAWRKVEGQRFVNVPMAAALDDRDGLTVLYVVDPKLTRNTNPKWVPYNAAKFLASLATGGYWYTAVPGVCVRAYLKGHYGHVNSWTGPVMGWRASRQQEPEYGWHPPDTGTVNTMSIIGGVDDDSCISVLNPKKYADTHCYIDRSGIHMVSEMHVLNPDRRNIDLIRAVNKGSLVFNAYQGKAQLIDCALPDLGPAPQGLNATYSASELWSLTHQSDSIFYDL